MAKNKYSNIILYIVTIVVILTLLTVSFNIISDKYSLLPKKNRAYDKFIAQKELDILFLGDSHADVGINPELINENSFNYALAGESYIENYYRLKRIIEVDKAIPKILILEADTSMREDENRFERYIYFYRRDLTLNQLIEYGGYDLGNVLSYYLGFVGRGAYFGLIITKGEKVSEYGHRSKSGIYSPSNRNVTFTTATNYDMHHLKDILELCKQNNIDVIFLKYPMTKESLKINKNTIPAFYDKFYDIAEESGIEFHILDYQGAYVNNSSMFVDAGHLNEQGSKDLSRKVAQDLKRLDYINQTIS